MKKLNSKKIGFSTLITVIILGAAALTIAITVLLTSTDSVDKIKVFQGKYISKNNANSCVERALNKLRLSSTYTGNESYTLPYGSCTVSTLSGSGATRTFQTTGTYSDFTSKVSISVSAISPQVQVSAWDEIP